MKTQFTLSAVMLFFCVAIGAFGAHALDNYIDFEGLKTFETGNKYHFYHGLAMLLLASLNAQYNNIFKSSFYLFLIGILLFSFNCYLYAVFKIKYFALIVPLGGICFLIGWLIVGLKSVKGRFV